MSNKYDVIVIGSGIGGLTVGAFLAREGMKVLVLEQHAKIGGYAHNFKRKKYIFESGIHSVPMGENGVIMYLLGLLGISDMVATVEYDDMYSISNPEYNYRMPARKEEAIEYLLKEFPHEKEGIKIFFDYASLFRSNIIEPFFTYDDHFEGEDLSFASRYHNKSYKEFLTSLFTDQKLINLLSGQWPYAGISSNLGANLFMFMMYVVHITEGSHTIKGGFSKLADALASVIKAKGGEIKTKSLVTSIKVSDGLARSVRTSKGEEYECNILVSNISPAIVHNKLLPEKAQSRRWKRRINNLKPSVSSVITYMGMKNGFQEYLDGNISFWHSSIDMEKIADEILVAPSKDVNHLIALATAEKEEYPTLTLMNFVRQSFSNNWKEDKKIFSARMIDKLEELHHGISDFIDYIEIGSPDTFERYTLNSEGSIYGFENTRSMYGEAKMPIETHIPNLFSTGHWGKPGCGVWNVMNNAYIVSRIIKNKLIK